MEQATQFRIEGLDEALEQISALSREISRLGESARIAASVLPELDLRLGLPDLIFEGARGDSGSSSGGLRLPDLTLPFAEALSNAISGALLPEIRALDEGIATALAGVLVPEFEGLRDSLSTVTSPITEAIQKLTGSVDSLSGKIGSVGFAGFPGPALSDQDRDLFLGSLHRLETQWSFGDALEMASVGSFLATSGHPLGILAALAWAAGVMSVWGIKKVMGDPVRPSSREANDADYRLERVKRFGNIDDFKSPFKASEQSLRLGEFASQISWFEDQIMAANKEAEAEIDPLEDDAPGAFLKREQARALRSYLAQKYLEVLELHKPATGLSPNYANEEVQQIAKRAASVEQTTGKDLVPFSEPPMSSFRWEPIKIDIKVLSDHPLSIRTDNPNPNIDLSWDFYAGPRMR